MDSECHHLQRIIIKSDALPSGHLDSIPPPQIPKAATTAHCVARALEIRFCETKQNETADDTYTIDTRWTDSQLRQTPFMS